MHLRTNRLWFSVIVQILYLNKVVQSVIGIQLVIPIWRPNQGLIKQQLQSSLTPLSLIIFHTPKAGRFLILGWLSALNILLEGILWNSGQEFQPFGARPHLKTLMSAFQMQKKK